MSRTYLYAFGSLTGTALQFLLRLEYVRAYLRKQNLFLFLRGHYCLLYPTKSKLFLVWLTPKSDITLTKTSTGMLHIQDNTHQNVINLFICTQQIQKQQMLYKLTLALLTCFWHAGGLCAFGNLWQPAGSLPCTLDSCIWNRQNKL